MRPFFERHDVLLAPLTARPPVAAGQWEGRGALRTLLGMLSVYPFTAQWNLTGQPAIAVPAGTTRTACRWAWSWSAATVRRPR